MKHTRPALLEGLNEHLHHHPEGVDDAAWMDVINKMDEVYSRLIDDEVELERKNTELEQSQQFIVSVISSMTDVLIVCDAAGRIERANAALCDLVGRQEAEIVGQPLAALLADEVSRDKAAEVSKAAFLGRQAQDVELNLLDRGRQAVPVDACCTPRTASNGRRAGTVWVGRPMGEIKRAYMELQQAHDALKRTQQQLIHSEKMASLGQLVAGVAHELNNPISFVLGNVHALQRYCERLQAYIEAQDGKQDPAALQGLRERLRIDHVLHDLPSLIDGTLEGASRTADIVNGLKRFSAMDKEEKRAVNLVQVIDRTILWMRRVQPQTVQIHWTPAAAVYVLGSEGQLQQVLTNLLQNAFDAIAAAKCPQGQVWVTLQQAQGRVHIRVADNGTGIPPEAMGRVFDPFFTSKPVGKGTGLGLSISYGLIEQHQGVLSVRNRSEGGAEFTVDLPQAPDVPAPTGGGPRSYGWCQGSLMRGWGICLAMCLWQLPAQAHLEHESQDEAELPAVEIRSGGEGEKALGLTDTASQGTVGADQIAKRPLARPADVLELVPGLVITQHSGQGKANQYFLRGFNLDHGTDFATTVNGVPVNMPTHAHGQGYSDLNFLIPELVERVDFRKGPYFVGQGDFASAGVADFHYRQQLDAPFADLSLGSYGYARALAADSGVWADGLRWLAAFEAMGDDGPWTNPDRLQKRNLYLSLAGGSAREGWSASAVAYRARWNSTDQVPQRLLDAGSWQGRSFSRWDAVDPSDGGETQRTSLAAEWHRIGQGTHDRVSVWALDYGLDLWSNFTYAMNNTTQGDQFAQHDRRQAMGLATSRQWHHAGGVWGDGFSTLGLNLRQDDIRVGLYNTVARQITSTVRDDQVRQSLLGLYGENQWQWTSWLRSIAGMELDRLDAQVQSHTLPDNSGVAQTALLSPKAGLVLGPWRKTEFYLNAGRGFHSNDARGMVIQRDPANPAQAMSPAPGLVASRGMEAGLRSQPTPNFLTSLALWRLDLDSELVYQGDTGTTTAGRASARYGLEWSSQWQPAQRWQLDLDLSWSHARYTEGSEERRYIANAQEQVAQFTLSCKPEAQWLLAVQVRSLGSAPLTDDNSVRSTPSVITNLRVQHDPTRRVTVTLDVFNLFDRRVNDIQYVYASQLAGESQAVTGLHVHPAEPFGVRLGLRVKF